MPHHESGSLDNSERLSISSLVDIPAEDDKYDLFGTAPDLLELMGSRAMHTENWNKTIQQAIDTDDVGALHKLTR